MPRPPRLARARALIHDRYPVLDLEIEGRPVRLGPEARGPIHAAGLVFVGEELAESAPELFPDREFPTNPGHSTTLHGFSDDRRLWLLYDGFLRSLAGDFTPGPIPIPD